MVTSTGFIHVFIVKVDLYQLAEYGAREHNIAALLGVCHGKTCVAREDVCQTGKSLSDVLRGGEGDV